MKRGIVLQVRTSEDKVTKETLVWVVIGQLPYAMKEGKLFFPKSSEILINTVAGENRAPDKFKKYMSLKVGSLVDVQRALNEFSNKAFVSDINVVSESAFTDKELFGDNAK